MQFNKKRLLEFLELLDAELENPVELTAVGGTAMTLLHIKDSTVDIDFDVTGREVDGLRRTLGNIPHGYKIDIYTNGLIFSQQLPEDYVEKRIPVKTTFKKIRLYALHPLDIVATKIGRLNDRDIEDVKACIKKQRLTPENIKSRATKVEYIGNEENYRANLKYVLKNLI